MPELWMGGALFAGLLAACWARVKDFASRITSLLIVRAKLEDEAAVALAYYCWDKMRRSRTGQRRFSSIKDFVRPLRRYQVIGYEMVGMQAVLFWYGWRPLFLGFDAGDSAKPGHYLGLTVSFLRGTFNLDSLLIEAIDSLNDYRHYGTRAKRFRVERRFGYGSRSRRMARMGGDEKGTSPESVSERQSPDRRLLKWKLEEIGADDAGGNPWAALAFPRQIEEMIVEAHRWLKSEDWYKEKRIPWRRGWLLYGPPGTGKTSLVRAIAQDLDLPVVSFDLATMDNDDFCKSWRDLMNQVPCIALLEDIDAVFHGRENRLGDEGGGLTFDCLLNCLSGIESADGVLVAVTTNRIEELDPALGTPTGDGASTRPGRIDRAIELGPLDEDCRRRMAGRILADCPALVDEIVAEGTGDTGAQFQDRCASVALSRYWSSNGDCQNQDVPQMPQGRGRHR